MADVASKQKTTALFLPTIVTRTRRHTELTKKPDKPDGKPVLCQRTFSSVFCVLFSHSYTAQFNLQCMGPLINNNNLTVIKLGKLTVINVLAVTKMLHS
jgi:hypothetical protein